MIIFWFVFIFTFISFIITGLGFGCGCMFYAFNNIENKNTEKELKIILKYSIISLIFLIIETIILIIFKQ